MKNLILTVGIVLLMVTGMVYDQDCQRLMAAERRLKWICEEAAYAAAVCLWRQDGSQEEAEQAVEWILRRNLDLNQSMEPKTYSPFQGPVSWEMEMEEGCVKIQVSCGDAAMQLSFLQGLVKVERQDIFDFSERFFGKRAETS